MGNKAKIGVISEAADNSWQNLSDLAAGKKAVIRLELSCDQSFQFRNNVDDSEKTVDYNTNDFFSIPYFEGLTSLDGLQVKAASGTFSGEYQY